GRKRRIFGHTGRTWPNCTDRTIGRAARPVVPPALGGQRGSGVTKDPSLPPLGPTLAQDFFTVSQDDGAPARGWRYTSSLASKGGVMTSSFRAKSFLVLVVVLVLCALPAAAQTTARIE